MVGICPVQTARCVCSERKDRPFRASPELPSPGAQVVTRWCIFVSRSELITTLRSELPKLGTLDQASVLRRQTLVVLEKLIHLCAYRSCLARPTPGFAVGSCFHYKQASPGASTRQVRGILNSIQPDYRLTYYRGLPERPYLPSCAWLHREDP